MYPRNIPPQSVVVWSAADTGANGQSATFDSVNCPFVSAFGHSSGATTITLMMSRDGSTFYAGPTQVLSGAGDFAINAQVGAQFLALQSTNDVTATGIISAK